MLLDRLKTAIDRHEHLTELLSQPEIVNDGQKFQQISKERSQIEKLSELGKEYIEVSKQISENEDLVRSGGEMASLAREDLQVLRQRFSELDAQLKIELLPKDPDEEKNVILEIRAGAGGDEASIFAQDLFRLYSRFAARQSWRVEILNESFSGQGGYKEVSASIEGQDVFRLLKYESGVHRVQRIPVTESGGRIHTSTVTVAIMPEATEAEIEVNDNDLRIDVFRAGGKGGQGVNTTDSAVRITHLPTNTVVICQDERSQIKNKAKAMKVLRARLLQVRVEEEAKKRSAQRKSQVGTGDRSERIRTYNYPQERVTDHRINLSLKKLSAVMEGELDEIIEALQKEDYSQQLAASGLNS